MERRLSEENESQQPERVIIEHQDGTICYLQGVDAIKWSEIMNNLVTLDFIDKNQEQNKLGSLHWKEAASLKEAAQANHVYFLLRDFYSNPQIILVTAPSLEMATEILNAQLKSENYPPGDFGELKELKTTQLTLTVLSPPGDRSLIR